MATITILPAQKSAEVPDGELLVEAGELAGVEMEAGCFNCSCGTCAAEVVSGRGEGYFDSLAGLLFFLLCGRLFQQKTYDRLSFDRDYTAFFPLSVIRLIRSCVNAPVVRLFSRYRMPINFPWCRIGVLMMDFGLRSWIYLSIW